VLSLGKVTERLALLCQLARGAAGSAPESVLELVAGGLDVWGLDRRHTLASRRAHPPSGAHSDEVGRGFRAKPAAYTD
jgi:hypothetical protein